MIVKEYLEGGRYVTEYRKGQKTLSVTEINKNRYWKIKLIEKNQDDQFNITKKYFEDKERLSDYITEVMNG